MWSRNSSSMGVQLGVLLCAMAEGFSAFGASGADCAFRRLPANDIIADSLLAFLARHGRSRMRLGLGLRLLLPLFCLGLLLLLLDRLRGLVAHIASGLGVAWGTGDRIARYQCYG